MIRILVITILVTVVNLSVKGQSIYGIDVSSSQNPINWTQVVNSGKSFAWIKATEGTNYVSTTFNTHTTNASATSIVTGVYHFARPDLNNSAVVEANHFVNTAGAYIGNNHLPPALDIEDPAFTTYTNANSVSSLATWLGTWINTVKNSTGVTPVIYTTRCIASSLYPYYSNGTIVSKLWIADWSNSAGSPANTTSCNWSSWPWLFHQYSGTGSVSGISSSTDLDIFNGGLSAFNTLISASGSTCTDNFESNDTYTSATNVFASPLNSNSSNYTITGTNIGFAGDVDWYKVNVGQCGILTLNLSNLPYNYDIELYGSTGTSQWINGSYNSGTNSETITYNFTGSSSTVYVKVYANQSSNYTTSSCYNLQFLWTPCSVSTCTYSLSQTSQTVPYTGGNYSFNINATSGAGCNWNVASGSTSGCGATNITSISSGTGPYTITYNVTPNPTANPLTCTLTVTGNNGYTQDYVINIDPNSNCANPQASPSSASFSSSGGSGSFQVNTGSGCYWDIYNNCSTMLTNITPTSGYGPATVTYNVISNSSSGNRSCNIYVSGTNSSHTINQTGVTPNCSSTTLTATNLNPATIASTGGSGSSNITLSDQSCSWSAVSNQPNWLSVNPTSNQYGNGNLSWNAQACTTGSQRQGTITISGPQTKTITINQTCSPPLCPNPPIANAGLNASYTAGMTIGGNPTAQNGPAPYTYSWSPSTGLSSTSVSNPTVSNLTNTTTYTVIITDASGCTASSSVTISAGGLCSAPLQTPQLQINGCNLSINPVANVVYQWYYNNTPIPNTNSNQVNAQSGNGQYYVLMTSLIDQDCIAQSSPIAINCPTGISDIGQLTNISVYPNPTNDILNVIGNGLRNDNYTATLTNVVGQKLFDNNFAITTNRIEEHIDVKQLSTGIYFLTISSGKTRQVFKINKQ